MDILEWSKCMETGIPAIDRQHKEIIKAISNVAIAAISGARPRDIAVLLNTLLNLFVDHFQTEEEYMDKMLYKQYKLHINEYMTRKDMLISFTERTKTTDNFSLSMFESFVVKWFQNHITCVDKTLADFILQQ